MWIAILTVVFLFGQQVELSGVGGHVAISANADGNVAATIKGVDRVGEGSGQNMIFGRGHREQLAFSARLQGVDHAHRQHIIAIVAKVGIKDQWNRLERLGLKSFSLQWFGSRSSVVQSLRIDVVGSCDFNVVLVQKPCLKFGRSGIQINFKGYSSGSFFRVGSQFRFTNFKFGFFDRHLFAREVLAVSDFGGGERFLQREA